MTTLRVKELNQHADILRTRGGETVTVRFVEPGDAEELQNYYRALSARSRYNRFLGAMSELPKTLLDRFTDVGRDDGFTVVVTVEVDGFATIIGEARYAYHAESGSFEFGMSIDDHWQGRGIGAVLMTNLECRAAAFGAASVFGDTLRSNDVMIALARKSGFSFARHPEDWKLVRFEKQIDAAPKDIPCASWRIAAATREAKVLVSGR
ncbi:GNAT family N-acetyltransferase [Bradyrhizobium sp. STM 3562]|uniref:GNAT family N-acetyltransferase n=1 Tax=Bradyrhizobium sp. STM 3562 TaxID=578924 RepID=UPI003890F768